MHKEHRKVYDYYYNSNFLFRIGFVNHLEASPPMDFHEHGSMTEFVYLKKGIQNYQITDKSYTIHQGEVFFTLPHEFHNTGGFPEEKSVLYYLIVDLSLVSRLNVFLSSDEYREMELFFKNIKSRIYQASPMLPDALEHLLHVCLHQTDFHFDTHVRNALSEALIALCTPVPSLPKTDDGLSIENSLNYIQTHLCDVIRISDLSAMENMSVSTYNKQFTKMTRMTPAEYILKLKIEKIKELLVTTEKPITEIAYDYGFSSSQYFATAFKRFCNVTPTQFRKKGIYLPSDEKSDIRSEYNV
ncbi:MAG: AraC family transcriptional regulator [Blautia sp.]|nr:AraC family transcriptional regulator [Blautia sp.]MDY3997628.1 AraC family transcriptional regulator [Blautia sp.]